MNVGTDLHNCKPVRRSRAVCARLCKVKGRPGLALAMTLGIIASLGRPDSSHAAGLVISAPEITTSAGSTGAFLVLLTDTDPTGSTPYNVAGDQFELTLTGPAGFSFTDVSTDTGGSPYNTPYIYSVSTADQLGLSLSIAPTNPFTVPTTDFLAADSGYYQPGGYPGYTSLNPGDVYALALVSYSVRRDGPDGQCRHDRVQPGQHQLVEQLDQLHPILDRQWLDHDRDGARTLDAGPGGNRDRGRIAGLRIATAGQGCEGRSLMCSANTLRARLPGLDFDDSALRGGPATRRS